MSADTTNVCVVIHEPEIVTITMTIEQLYLMQTIMDVARQDECDEEEEIRAACGDAIVTTVAFWIADRIRMIEEEEEA
jgi:hypothetical protein